MEKVDLVVIGAGWAGLSAAKTYIELHPTANVLVFDAADSVGGVWAEHRLYPGLRSNNVVGTYEYPDYPMDESFGVKAGEHIPGAVLHKYLSSYAQKFGVSERMRLNTKVETAEKKENGWLLHTSTEHGSEQYLTEKLIVATGLTSEAFVPTFDGQERFNAPIFHCRDFRDHADTLKTAEDVVVYGGTKSAWDAAHAYASAGVQVDMVIRESGHGPVWMSPAFVTPLKRLLEQLVHTRLLTFFSPCIWGFADGYNGIRNFFHGSWLGRKIVDGFWGILKNDVLTLNGFDKHPEVKKLKPWSNPFFIGAGLSILNYETDFFDLVKEGKIRVTIADIDSLSEKKIHLSNGDVLKGDALVCATGWKHHPPMKFLPEGIDAKLGMPHYSASEQASVQQANKEILDRFPRLKDQPIPNPKAKPLPGTPSLKPNQPYRLYRFTVPPAFVDDRSIAFAGALMNVSTSTLVHIQALWLSAYFDGVIKPTGDVEYETILHSQFGAWRYPVGFGSRFPDFVFDAVPFYDLMLGELGINSHRKKGAIAELFEPYGPQDYRGVMEEYKAAHPLKA